MIITFASGDTRRIWEGEWVHRYPGTVQQRARRKLRMLHNAQTTADLMIPPANRLEKLKGDFQGFHSIRVNDQWRLVSRWESGNAYDVELLDYH